MGICGKNAGFNKKIYVKIGEQMHMRLLFLQGVLYNERSGTDL